MPVVQRRHEKSVHLFQWRYKEILVQADKCPERNRRRYGDCGRVGEGNSKILDSGGSDYVIKPFENKCVEEQIESLRGD